MKLPILVQKDMLEKKNENYINEKPKTEKTPIQTKVDTVNIAEEKVNQPLKSSSAETSKSSSDSEAASDNTQSKCNISDNGTFEK